MGIQSSWVRATQRSASARALLQALIVTQTSSTGTCNMAEEIHTGYSPDLDDAREHGMNLHKRQSRVTVKYNRKQLQKRLDVEKWIDEGLDKLYEGKVSECPHASSQVLVTEFTLETTGRLPLKNKLNYSTVSMYFQMLCHTLFWNIWLQKCATVPSLRI